MTEIEKKALELENTVRRERGFPEYKTINRAGCYGDEVICRSIEAHEAYRQEVSDAMQAVLDYCGGNLTPLTRGTLSHFIIAKPVDPLVEVLDELGWCNTNLMAADLRKALASRGLKIVEAGND